jgi:hypothetical protein
MKFFATIFAASVAVAAAADCEITALRGLVSSPDVGPCSAESGYNLVPPLAPPTDAQVAKMCQSKACVNLISSVLATNPVECKVPVGGNIMLRADLLDKVSNACKAAPGAPSVAPGAPSVAPGAPSVAPGAPSVAPGAPSVAPGATTVAPAASSEAPSAATPEDSEATVVIEDPAASLGGSVGSSGSFDGDEIVEPEADDLEDSASPSPAPTESAAVVSTVGVAAVVASVAFMMAA